MAEFAYDLVAPEYDVDNPVGTKPRRSYIICSTPRSGSTLLAEGMLATGCMGNPVEYFNPVHGEPLTVRWDVPTLQEYLTTLVQKRTDRSGAFSLKTHWAQLDVFYQHYLAERGEQTLLEAMQNDPAEAHRQRRAFLDSFFPNITYIHIIRVNRIRQAVSWWVGSQTGRWADFAQEPEQSEQQLPYDFHAIRAYHDALTVADAHWTDFFRINNIRPRTIVYEDFATNYKQTLLGLIDAAGSAPAPDIAKPRLRQQANRSSEIYVEQFTKDLESLATLL